MFYNIIDEVGDNLKILKYKKLSNGKYKITFDNDEDLELYEEVILKYELLLKREISSSIINDIEKLNNEYEVYYFSLKSLKSRYKSSYELKKILLAQSYDINIVDKVISKLEKQGYLNDRSFTKGYINNQIITSSKGPNRIIKDLSMKGVPLEVISSEIEVFNEEIQLEKINKIIKISLKSNRNKGGNVLKNKIVNNLINTGYSYEIISKVINNYDFNDTFDIAKKEYDKLYNKLSKKYSGSELDYKIKEKLYQKGLNYEETY